MDTLQTDVASGSPSDGMLASASLADSSTATGDLQSGESQPSVTGAPDATQQQAPPDPLADLPSLEELKTQAEQKLPGAQGMLNLRTAYEAQKAEYESLQSLKPWQDITQKFNAPDEVIALQELVQKIHTPDPNKPSGYTALPFLQQLETESPGSTDVILGDLLVMQVPKEGGGTETLARQLLRSWDLDPDRISDYRNIDQRAPQAGFVTTDQLVGIDPRFHEAFRSLTAGQREDILAQRDATTGQYPPHVLDNLQDKAEALEARQFREQQQQREQAEQQRQQQLWEQQTETAVTEDIFNLRRSMYESIHQGLSSQWKPTSDEGQNAVEYAKVMGTLACLLDPDLRFTAEAGLKAAGVTLDPKFDELVQAFAGGRAEYVKQTRMGDQMRARTALSSANLAQQQLLVKLNQYSLALAKPSAERLQAQSQATVNSLNGATARVIPQGSTTGAPNGNSNPYDANPYQLGTQEYKAWNRNMDSQMGVTKAGTFG